MNPFRRLFVLPIVNFLEKARKRSPRLVRKIITSTNANGTTYQQTVWVLPNEAKADRPRGAQFDMFGDDSAAESEAPAGPGQFDMFDDSDPAPAPPKEEEVVPKPKRPRLGIRKPKKLEAKKVTEPELGEATETPEVAKPETPVKPKTEIAPDPVLLDTPASDWKMPIADAEFRDYGSWSSKGKHLAPKTRANLNAEIADLVLRPRDSLTESDLEKIRMYSGFGGVAAENERGVLYDYYTSPPVARMTWQLLDKIVPVQAGESVLEPSCGSGVFFEVAPAGLDMTGVELDTRTAAVASIVQDKAKIHTGSFEQFNLASDKKFSRAVGNAPFGERSVLTSFIDMPEEKSLDRYFMRRTLDSLQAGGTMGMIVHPGVMNGKMNTEWRADMLRRGQFMGAIRLPDKSFRHSNTQVQPDIIFFRKYPDEVASRLAMLTDEEITTAGFMNQDWVDGEYFETHPEHILGTLERGAGQWGSDVVSGTLSAADMDRAVLAFSPEDSIPASAMDSLRSLTPGWKPDEAPALGKYLNLEENEAVAFAAKTLTVGMTKSVNGVLYRLNDNHRWERIDGNADKIDQVKAIAGKVRAIRSAMRAGEPTDDLQRDARRLIQSFKEAHGEAPADDIDIKRVLKAKASVTGIYEGLVGIDSPILMRPNLYDKEIESKDGFAPEVKALLEIRNTMSVATPEMIRHYFPESAEEIVAAMQKNPDCFLTTDGVWQLREDFIAGNAWEKIDAMKAAIEEHGDWKDECEKWRHGIAEVERAVGWVPIEDADFAPQSSWIPEDIINRWLVSEDGLGQGISVGYAVGKNSEGKWGRKTTDTKHVKGSYNRYTGDFDEGYDIPEGTWEESNSDYIYFLNSQKQRSKYNDTETYNRMTADNFKSWVSTHDADRNQLERIYNRLFNTEMKVATKTYSVDLKGWNPAIVLGGHQWQTIHHMYRAGKGISALGTGFGKTLAAIGLFGLLKQENKINRAMIQVPNNKVRDWVKTFKKSMPGMKIGYVDATAKGYGDQVNRYKMYQELANGDYDAIILPESAASEIQLSAEHDKEITDSIVATQTANTEAKSARKQEQAKDKAQAKLKDGKTNKTITFEDLGCDAIFCDEAHRNKNLFTSSLSRETGMNDGRKSDRAMSFFKKCEYTRRQHNGNNVFGLTATPLTNSPLEYYNMLMLVAPEELAKLHIATIDDFINNFADIQMGTKIDWTTSVAKEGKVLKGFKNLRTLQDIFFKYTDMQNDPKSIGLKKPTASNNPNVIPLCPEQTAVMRKISAELEAYRKLSKEARSESSENYLTFYSRLRTASLDLELYAPETYKGWHNPKIDTMAENAMASYKATGGGQVVFCDRVVSGDGTFNMHEKVKAALVAQGFKPEEVVVVNGLTKTGGKKSDAALETDVADAIDGFNQGKYKVILGTTQTIGEGVNLQRNSAALHHLDIPYRPSDFIQRNGRIDRQGNKQEHVTLNTYLAAGTIDNYSVGLVQGKANWIDQILKTKSNVFTNPDDDSFIDVDEMMLALSEEWGEAGKAEDRRAALATSKAEKIKKLNQDKAHDALTGLSMVRGSLVGFTGDKGTTQYQNRIRRMHVLEEALQNNPEFHNLNIVGDNPPEFMYDKENRLVYQTGDIIVTSGAIFRAGVFDHKKQTMGLTNLKDGTDHEWRRGQFPGRYYHSAGAEAFTPVVLHNPTPEELSFYETAKDASGFVSLPAEVKRARYKEFVDYTGVGWRDYVPVRTENGKITFASGSNYYEAKAAARKNGEKFDVMNLYDPADKKEIHDSIVNGDAERNWRESPIIEDVGLSPAFDIAARRAFENDDLGKKILPLIGEKPIRLSSVVESVYAEDGTTDSRYREYNVKSAIKGHPDYVLSDRQRFDDGSADYLVYKKADVQKSMSQPFHTRARLFTLR